MCGGGGGVLGEVANFATGGLLNAVTNGDYAAPIGDIAAIATGNPELIPLINAGATTASNLGHGQSLGKSLARGGISGVEALGAQELAGAVGIGEGNSAFNSALGITGDNPAGTGLPDIGKGISDLFSSSGAGGSTSASGAGGVNSPISSASGVPATVAAAPAGGGTGIGAAGAAAPAGVTPDTGLPWLDPNYINPPAEGAGLSSVGSAATSGSNVGSGTVGTSGLPNGISSDVGSSISQAANGLSSADNNFLSNAANSAGSTNATGSLVGSTASSAPSSLNKFISDRSFSNAGNILTSNPGALISAAGLGVSALEGNKKSGAEKNLQAEAGELSSQGNQLQGYLNSGTLPPGLQAGIKQAADSAKATIRSQYASRGMAGSSAEQQDLAAVDARAQAQGAQMAMQLLQTGIGETGLASGLYEQLLNQSVANDKGLSSAIANFASSLAGGQSGRGGRTVNYSGSE